MRITLFDRTLTTGPTPGGVLPSSVVRALLHCASQPLDELGSRCFYRASGEPIAGLGPIRIDVTRRRADRIPPLAGEEPG